MKDANRVTTGLAGFDQVIQNLQMGDNVVFRVQRIEEYIGFVHPFVQHNMASGRKVVYLRFAQHQPLISQPSEAKVYQVDARDGFETFASQVYQIISAEGEGICYIFDCLSDLLVAWATDILVSKFFFVICPYLYQMQTIAYFALFRNTNSFKTLSTIRDIAQVLLDVYTINGTTYLQPLKVWQRYTPTIFLPHYQQGTEFRPVTRSCQAAELLETWESEFSNPKRKLDYWDRVFIDALELQAKIEAREASAESEQDMVEKLSKIMLTRDEQFLQLLKEVFSLADLLQIKARLVGSGFIGGKALGMLLARKILSRDVHEDWNQLLEPHDSFYIGSDVFYSFLIENHLWTQRMEQRQPGKYFSVAAQLRSKILQGSFPENLQEQFKRVLEYFGQSPVIVRSSSLLEDSFGNAFAGKYESIFCINQGTLKERYAQFETAVKQIFASTMNEEALMYRLKRGIHQQDEQMALLVQRVSGNFHEHLFYPDLAGVGFSHNTYVWDQDMDPQAGMLRIVLGLGTRAVNRMEGDYARTMALDHPLLKPYSGLPDFQKFSQREVDVLDIASQQVTNISLEQTFTQNPQLKLTGVVERDYTTEKVMAKLGLKKREAWIASFDQMAKKSCFPKVIQNMLKTLEKAYAYPVDIEFTVNFRSEREFKINLLQCRPLQVKGLTARVEMPHSVNPRQVLFHSQGSFMGGNIQKEIQRIIYVDFHQYSKLTETQRYTVARTIGKLNRLIDKEHSSVLLLGPGRWGTSTPSLGVPVAFSEINNVAVLGEIAYPSAGYMPEVSFGTHFFQDLVESDIFYVGLFPERKGVSFQQNLLGDFENQLSNLVADSAGLERVIGVYDFTGSAQSLHIIADTIAQEVLCLLKQ